VYPHMRHLVLLVVAATSSAAAADPKPEPLAVVPVDVDFCATDCRLVSTDKLPGVGSVEVYDAKPLSEVILVIQAAHEKVGAHLDLHVTAHDTVVRETHRVAGFHDGIVTDRKATPNNAVALLFDVERKRDGKPYRESYAVACGGSAGWTCTVTKLAACSVSSWEPPRVDYRCDGELTLKAR